MHSKIITIDGVYEKVIKWDICIYRKREKKSYTAGPAALSSSESGKKTLVQSSILFIFSRVDARTLRLSTPDINCL